MNCICQNGWTHPQCPRHGEYVGQLAGQAALINQQAYKVAAVKDDDPVSPSHYKTTAGIEAIDVIESFKLNYRLGSALKYILRAGKKGPADTDIRKAMWFLQRELDKGGDSGVGGDRTK